MTSAQDKFLKGSNLSGLLSACAGQVITVELRNEAYVTGKLVASDGFMSCMLENARLIDPSGNQQKFDNFFVQNRLIRYVQLPESLDVGEFLNKQTSMLQPGRGRGRGRGISKQRQQILDKREARRQEDIRNAHKMKEEMNKMKLKDEK